MAPIDTPIQPAAASALERLRAIAAAVPDRAFGERLAKVYEEGTRAIQGLGLLALDTYDEMAETGSPDLSMWEKLAPVIRNTLLDINGLLATVHAQFPARSQSIGDLIGEALEEPGGGREALARMHQQEAAEQIQRLGNMIAAEVSNLGERMRSPQVVSDHWNLLADMQEFRGKFRNLVGDLLFLTASAFDSVSRVEVIPFYAQDVRDAVETRRAVTDVGRLMNMHATRMASAQASQVADYLAGLVKDLDAFGRSAAYLHLRTQDKRRFVEFRALLRRFPGGLDRPQLVRSLEEFAQFTRSLSGINRRAVLVDHDHEVLAACAVGLEQVDQTRASDAAAALALFVQALEAAQDLYGRSPSLDAYLRRAKRRDLSGLSAEALGAEVEMMRTLLAGATAR